MSNSEEHQAMRITPKLWDWLEEKGATDFELTAFNVLEPAAQVSAMLRIDEGMPVGEALDSVADLQRDLGR